MLVFEPDPIFSRSVVGAVENKCAQVFNERAGRVDDETGTDTGKFFGQGETSKAALWLSSSEICDLFSSAQTAYGARVQIKLDGCSNRKAGSWLQTPEM